MRVASTLSWMVGRRPASRSLWNSGGMSRAKVSIPASMRWSISGWAIMEGGMKKGGKKASAMRAESGERSSSTMAIAALLSCSGIAVEAL